MEAPGPLGVLGRVLGRVLGGSWGALETPWRVLGDPLEDLEVPQGVLGGPFENPWGRDEPQGPRNLFWGFSARVRRHQKDPKMSPNLVTEVLTLEIVFI